MLDFDAPTDEGFRDHLREESIVMIVTACPEDEPEEEQTEEGLDAVETPCGL